MISNCAIGFDLQRAKIIENIFEEYQIDQVHVHQFDCIPAIFPACVNKQKPYVAFVHTGIEGIYNWFENQYFDYKGMFTIFFQKASKIVCITENAKEENKRKYGVSDDKYLVRNNSIKFSNDIINNNNIPSKIEKFLIISRLGEEKRISIINAIKIFKEYSLRHPEARLTIVGDGSIKNDIIKEIEDIKDKVTFLGTRTDVYKIFLENDIVIGLDRCILEAIVLKRIAIVSGYSDIKGMVTPENIKQFAIENFSGKELQNRNIDDIINEIEQLSIDRIKQITEQNYIFSYENLNLDKNIYIFEGNPEEYKLEIEDYFKLENNLIDRMEKLEEEKNSLSNEIQKKQEKLEQQIKDITQKNIETTNNLKNELDISKQELNKYKELYEKEMIENEKISTKIRKRIYKIYKNLLKNNTNK